MKKQSPFYKTGVSRSPFNAHEPGHEELPQYHIKELVRNKRLDYPIIETPNPKILNKNTVDKARGLVRGYSGGKYQATRLDIHRDAPKPRGIIKPKITAPKKINL